MCSDGSDETDRSILGQNHGFGGRFVYQINQGATAICLPVVPRDARGGIRGCPGGYKRMPGVVQEDARGVGVYEDARRGRYKRMPGWVYEDARGGGYMRMPGGEGIRGCPGEWV